MESSNDASKEKNKENENAKPNPIIEKIKSRYILSKIYGNIPKKKKLGIVKYNKKIQNRLNLSTKDYKEFSETFTQIEIEIIPAKDKYGKFINIYTNDEFYHIYFNDNKEEIKDKYEIYEEDKVFKIKIKIDYQVKSFEYLFSDCECIESIYFTKFHRNNINNMSMMFSRCSSLKEVNASNVITNNVTNMSWMFSGCSSLKELDLSNFNTNNLIDISGLFSKCSSLIKINISNFN